MRRPACSGSVAPAVALLALLAGCGSDKGGGPLAPVDDGGPSFGGSSQVGPGDTGADGLPSWQDAGATGGGKDTAGPVGTGTCATSDQCNDHDSCTDDVCAGGICYHTNNAAPCDDGDSCTTGDACWKGACAGEPIVCDDENPCTEQACQDGACYLKSLSADPGCAPAIAVVSPARGATVSGPGPVEVAGSVTLPGGPLASLTLNGQQVTVDEEGSFSIPFSPKVGVNLLSFEALGVGGSSARAAQSFAWSPTLHALGNTSQLTLVDGASGLWLDREVFDDDDPQDLDDISALAWLLLDDFDVNAAIPDPLFAEGQEPSFGWCTWDVGVGQVDYQISDVDVLPVPGAIRIHGELTGFKAHFDAVASWCPDAIGWVYADAISLDAELSVVVTPGGSLDVDVLWVDVSITGVNVDATNGTAALFDWLINWFEDDLAAKVETELETFVPTQIAPLVDGLLSGFTSYKTAITVPALLPSGAPVKVSVDIRAGQAGFASLGATFHLRGGAGAAKQSSHTSPGTLARGACGAGGGDPASCLGVCGGQAPAGCYCDADCVKYGDCCTDACKLCGQCLTVPPDESCGGKCGGQAPAGCYCDVDCLKYGDCCKDACDSCGHCKGTSFVATPLPKAAAVELFVHEDLLNQLLFAVWWGGGLDLKLTDAAVPDAKSLGITNVDLDVDLTLPPIVTTCTPDGKPELQVGDVRVTGTFDLLGTKTTVDAFATALVKVAVTLKPAGGAADLSFQLQGLRAFDSQVIAAEGLGPTGPALIESLLNQATIESLLGDQLSSVLAAWPLPEIDIAPFVPGLGPGAKILFVPKTVTHHQGAVILSGSIQGP